MLFNSYLFILGFLPLALLGYFGLNRWRKHLLAKVWLVALSLVFYAYFNTSYLAIILISILGNYLLSRCMLGNAKAWVRKLCYGAGLLGNLGVLGYYKYYNFFIANINAAFGADFTLHRLVLPLGISFFTFQQLSYVIDSYRRKVPRYSLVDYALFVTFFPQLIAGPIVLHSEIVPQFEDPRNRTFNFDNFAPGLYAFGLGLAKKVLVADTFAKVVDYGFGAAGLNTPEAFFVVLGFALQLYFDFSGYCDMALGLGRMFNIHIPLNFNSPYKSLNIREFWTRWHMTLSRFFSQYVYLPLGGSRKGLARTCLNLVVVFALSGLWHGAGWMFLIWGLLHGVASALYRLTRKPYDALHPALQWLLTFGFVCLTWIIFRAPSMAVALRVFGSLFAMDFGAVAPAITDAFKLPFGALAGWSSTLAMLGYAAAMLAVLGCPNTAELTARFRPTWRTGLATVLCVFISVLSLSGVNVFLYYNF
ncbi:MAG: MBOAT family protein [Oscillospiraceae bacterium]|nr:MBOAT family protein [Oscillospiraceae bacterium]